MISHESISAALSQHAANHSFSLEVFKELSSTNDHLREISAKDFDGSVRLCVTDWQTAGHGRRGKAWSSKTGNLRHRLAKPSGDLLGLSLVTGIAVVQVLNDQCGIGGQLKWPNDVLVQDRKLGGLLIELLPVAGSGVTDVLTGIGLNVHHQSEFDELGIGATSLEALGITKTLDRSDLIARIAAEVTSLYVEFETTGWAAFDERWQSVDALYGRAVAVSGGSALTGIARGVSENGALAVETTDGIQQVVAGEVSVRPV